jgi:GNAT superfamily N-acetyltransferase
MTIRPLTPSRWKDLEALFGARGACGGCWCMYWRLPRPAFERQKGEGNRRAFKKIVATGQTPGLLAYDGDRPVAWCAIAPRTEYPKMARSRILQPVDDQPVWSVSCLFVAKPYRRRGVSVRLLEAAADYVRRRGGRIVEGYPVEAPGKVADPFVWTGLASAFRKAGFTEVARRSKTRPIMRRGLR